MLKNFYPIVLAIGFSWRDLLEPDYQRFEQYIPLIVQYALDNPLPKGTLLNVNFPDKSHKTFKGFCLARQGKEFWVENPDKRTHPAEGSDYYWLGAKIASYDEHEDSVISWLNKGYITVVPVQVSELTDQTYLKEHKANFANLNNLVQLQNNQAAIK